MLGILSIAPGWRDRAFFMPLKLTTVSRLTLKSSAIPERVSPLRTIYALKQSPRSGRSSVDTPATLASPPLFAVTPLAMP